MVERALDDRFAANRCRHRLGRRDRLTFGGFALAHHLIGWAGIHTVSGQAPAPCQGGFSW
jgi:hypothetical protein